MLITAANKSFAEGLGENLFTVPVSLNASSFSIDSISEFVLGTDEVPGGTLFYENAFFSGRPLYVILPQCVPNFSLSVPYQIGNMRIQQDVTCVQGLPLWRGSSSIVDDELYKGYQEGNEVIAAYDLLNSNDKNLDVVISYNSTFNGGTTLYNSGPRISRVTRSINVISNAFLQFSRGNDVKVLFEYVKEMPKADTKIKLDVSSVLGTLFFVWILVLPFPIIMTYLVYEKQKKLKIMMKMHGLGDGPYWMISYAYFLLLSSIYMLCFVIFGSFTGLKFFRLNDYGIQFAFYFVYINLQISLAFIISLYFSDVKTATVTGYIYVFACGLLGQFLFQFFVENTSFKRGWILVMEIIPGFSLYRGMYELSQYALVGNIMGTPGMRWTDLSDSENGMRDVLIIMTVEWWVFLSLAYYLDQVGSFGNGIRKAILHLRPHSQMKPSSSPNLSSPKHGSDVFLEAERSDVSQERKVVEQLLLEPSTNYAIICDDLKKVYPGRDGNPEKLAVRGLSLALPFGECFGMLGPNGAGKSTLINMLIGLLRPTSGTAFIHGMDLRLEKNKIYSGIGVCPQHDLLWETLTGKEHLLFYGRLKNLKGVELDQEVEESLKSVKLFHGGVGDKQAGKYSGGMKRRLSVAISLIGNPKVVFMDEPGTGLDPASKGDLWNVVRRAKQDRAIILTTHSMEEAEALCDRVGIFADGSLQCVGNTRDLKARYGGTFVLTITSSSAEEEELESLVRRLCPSARRIYHISGTLKFELPKENIKIANVFQAMENAKRKFTIHAWGLADTTMEDVFFKVVKEVESSYDH